MANPTWPAGLPYDVDLGAFKILEATRPPIVTEFEGGPPMLRPTGGGKRAKLAYRIPWDHASQLETWRAFHEGTLYDGSARFDMPVWRPATELYEVRTVLLEKGQYQVDPWGLGWAVSFNLFVFNWN